MDRDPELVRSSYSGPVTHQAITVRLKIYRLESDRQWVLEMVNQNGTSDRLGAPVRRGRGRVRGVRGSRGAGRHGRVPGQNGIAGLPFPDPALRTRLTRPGLVPADLR